MRSFNSTTAPSNSDVSNWAMDAAFAEQFFWTCRVASSHRFRRHRTRLSSEKARRDPSIASRWTAAKSSAYSYTFRVASAIFENCSTVGPTTTIASTSTMRQHQATIPTRRSIRRRAEAIIESPSISLFSGEGIVSFGALNGIYSQTWPTYFILVTPTLLEWGQKGFLLHSSYPQNQQPPSSNLAECYAHLNLVLDLTACVRVHDLYTTLGSCPPCAAEPR